MKTVFVLLNYTHLRHSTLTHFEVAAVSASLKFISVVCIASTFVAGYGKIGVLAKIVALGFALDTYE